VRRSVCSIALLLVCLEWKPNSYDYRTQLPSFPKLQHCLFDQVALGASFQGAMDIVFTVVRCHDY
jgi:hypothetical protein